MRKPLRFLIVLLPSLLLAGGVALYLRTRPEPPLPDEPGGPAKLVVVIAFDQMRGDYLDGERAKYFCEDGFERMKREGAWYSDAHLPYANTITGPGHASLSTGVPPAVHGIINNSWYDRGAKASVYCASIPGKHHRIPNIGESRTSQGETGFTPERLLVPTLGDHLRASRERSSKVFSLSLKDRSACLMGGARANGAYCFDSRTAEFCTSSFYADRVAPWVTEFNKRKLPDQWFNASWDRLLDPKIYDETVGPDEGLGEAVKERVFPHPLKRGDSPNRVFYETVETSPYGNELLWEFAKACLKAEKLGQGNGNHMLFLSFSSNDRIGHTWGPDSHEVLDITLRSDRLIADILHHLDETVGVGKYTVFVSADHGICPMPEVSQKKDHPAAVRFNPGEEIEELGSALDKTFGAVGKTPSAWFDELGFPEIYLNRAAIQAKGLNLADVESEAAQWAGNRQRISTAYTRTMMEGPPLKEEMARRVQLSFHPARSGDVFLVAKPYCLPIGNKLSTGTTHGSPYDYDTHIPVLMYGAGIPVLRHDEPVSSLIMAPAICRALGLDPPPHLSEKLPADWGKPANAEK